MTETRKFASSHLWTGETRQGCHLRFRYGFRLRLGDARRYCDSLRH